MKKIFPPARADRAAGLSSEERRKTCRANCCTYVFALTREEVRKGIYKYNPARPYYLARDPDGYCSYLDRETFSCKIHDIRPLRCRKFACTFSGEKAAAR